MGRPRRDDTDLRNAILKLLPEDGWMSTGDIRDRLPPNMLPHGPKGRQRLARTLDRMEEEWLLMRMEKFPGRGRGPFWRKLAGPLKWEHVHYALFNGIRERAYKEAPPRIVTEIRAGVYTYGGGVPRAVDEAVHEAFELLTRAGDLASEARQGLRWVLAQLHLRRRLEREANNHLRRALARFPPVPSATAILAVPQVGKVGQGSVYPISTTRVRTETGEIVRRVGPIHRPGKKGKPRAHASSPR